MIDEIKTRIEQLYGVDIQRYIEGTRINKEDLDNEIMSMGQFVYEVGYLASLTAADKQSADHNVKYMYAKLDTDIRRQLQEQGIKMTEGKIDAEIKIDPSYLDAQRQAVEAGLLHDEAVSLREAYRQKGYLLKEMADMVIQGFTTATSYVDKR